MVQIYADGPYMKFIQVRRFYPSHFLIYFPYTQTIQTELRHFERRPLIEKLVASLGSSNNIRAITSFNKSMLLI